MFVHAFINVAARVIIEVQEKSQRTGASLVSLVCSNTHFRITFIFKSAPPLDWASVFVISFRAVLHAVTNVFSVHTVPESIADEVVLSFASVLILFAMHFAVHFVFTVCAVSDGIAEPGFQNASSVSARKLVISTVSHRVWFTVEFIAAVRTVPFGVTPPTIRDAFAVTASEFSSIAAPWQHRTRVFIGPVPAVVITVTLEVLTDASFVVALKFVLPTPD